MAITLIKPEYDQWSPGEHNGTFRGNNLAFIAATEALKFWETDKFGKEVQQKGEFLSEAVKSIIEKFPELHATARGRGLMQGIAVGVDGLSDKICAEAFDRGLILETSGPNGEVVKFLPPLIIDEKGLKEGLDVLEESIEHVLQTK